MTWTFFLCGVFKEGKDFRSNFPNLLCDLAPCSPSYGHTRVFTQAQKRPEGMQGKSSADGQIYHQLGQSQESCSYFIPSVKLLTSNPTNTLFDDIKLALLFVV